jgi:putative two-component system response regulator
MALAQFQNALADYAAHAHGRVLVAGAGLTLVAEALWREGYAVARATDGRTALEHVRTRPVDIVVLECTLPGLGGFEVCRRLKRDQNTRLTPVILVHGGRSSRARRLEAIEAGTDALIARTDDLGEVSARVQSLVRMKRYTDDLEQTTSIMLMLAAVIEARGGYPEGHCHRMANYAAALGRRLGLDHQTLEHVRRGAFLHDVGMLGVPEAVLLKPGPLEPAELELVRAHAVLGESLVANLRSLQPVGEIIRHHHERRDGSGYPDGLYGDEISAAAEIVRVVETYEALTAPRPYQPVRSSADAIETLKRQVELGWHLEEPVSAFAGIVQAGEVAGALP